jgi:hypothetical protein
MANREAIVRSNILILTALLALLAAQAAAFAQSDDSSKRPWVVAKSDNCAIAVPRDWTNLDKFIPAILVDRQADGEGGVPAKDEAGTDVKCEILIEHVEIVPKLPDAGGVIIHRILDNKQTEPLTQPAGQRLKLADGSDAFLVWLEIQQNDRHVLIYKLLCKTDSRHGFVVTGTLSAGKNSNLPSGKGKVGTWLRALICSFVKDPSKIDAQKVDQAYRDRDSQG